MSDMIKRVAQAIKADAAKGRFPIGDSMAESMARAAIKAMREPTDEMVNAMEEGLITERIAEYKAMIDAALQPSI